ncbi:MAG TPA: peptidylprolyl isomerase [bacterium]|nr:peptidylprolyl isomerase [bacterium]
MITHAMNGIFRPLSRLVLIPAVTAAGKTVSYHQVVELAHGMKGFAGAQTNAQAFEEALSVSVYRLYVKSLASAHDVRVASTEVDAYVVDETILAPGLEVAGWKRSDYEKYLVAPLLLAQQTEMAVKADDAYQAEALESMESYRKKLAQGMPFADVAQNFSEDVTAIARGDLGIMNVGTLPDWLVPALELEPGEISQVLSAPDAYWTVTMLEYYPSEVPEQAAVHFRGLAVKKLPFPQILDAMTFDYPPMVFVW